MEPNQAARFVQNGTVYSQPGIEAEEVELYEAENNPDTQEKFSAQLCRSLKWTGGFMVFAGSHLGVASAIMDVNGNLDTLPAIIVGRDHDTDTPVLLSVKQVMALSQFFVTATGFMLFGIGYFMPKINGWMTPAPAGHLKHT